VLSSLTSTHPAAESIFYNIVGGLLTVPCAAGFAEIWKRWRRRDFKKVFGPGQKSFVVVYGSLVVRQDIIQKLATNSPGDLMSRFTFAKPSVPGQVYSAQTVGSGCELRGAAYLSAGLRVGGSIDASVASDDSVKGKLDLDFVSLGYWNNLKTIDLIENSRNNFAHFDIQKGAFLSKKSGRQIFTVPPGYEHGIILRIHPSQFPDRTWICCAGHGEWGTSGCAWFLSRKWNALTEQLSSDEQFMALIKVRQTQDESAELVRLFKSPQEIESFIQQG
jgi:hypothetical protein